MDKILKYELIIKGLILGGIGPIILIFIIIPLINFIVKTVIVSIMILIIIITGLILSGYIIALLQIIKILDTLTATNTIIQIIKINIMIEKILKNIFHMNNKKLFFSNNYMKILQYLSNISEKNDNFITILNYMDYSQEKARMIMINNENKLKKHNKGIILYYKLLKISMNENSENEIIKGYDYNNVDITLESEIINKHC